MQDTVDLKKTVNLPRTAFPMKANLPQNEPRLLAHWDQTRLYDRIRQARAGGPLFILHDGPHYANNRIHAGTAFNKVLKDFIVKSRTMSGFDAPYVPGWDCHGLPIELRVDNELGPRKAAMTLAEIRAECRRYATKWVDIQRDDFRRLGVLGRWDNPYLTMTPDYEAPADELREFDQWILVRAENLVRDCRRWYDELAFHRVYRAVYDFATIDLSAVYFDVLKDRLYTSAPRWPGRRSGQTAIYRITYALVRLLAPLVSFTAEEVWQHFRKPAGAPDSVHLALFPEPEELTAGIPAEQRSRTANWERLMEVRESVLKSLETARQEKLIGKSLDARVRLRGDADLFPLLEEYAPELPALFIVSQVELDRLPGEPLSVEVERAAGDKCERCWKYTTDVGSQSDWPTVCAACAEAVEEMRKASV